MKKLFVILLSVILIQTQASAQGCVAIRSTGGFCTTEASGHNMSGAGSWIFTANNRYFKSFRHFVGKEEQTERVENNTEVINHSYALDLNLARIINPRWSVAINVPVNANSRSSLYEHDRKNRYSTHSFGLGDMRFTVYRWMLDPVKHQRGNIQLGLGIKLPTGDYQFMDYFHKDSGLVLGPVDQSIQLGDGGTGFTVELNGYHHFSNLVSVYGNFYYLLNPREQNGVSTARGSQVAKDAVTYGSAVMSVPDQYLIRGGANLSFNRLVVSGGVRYECLPATDLIGGSAGFRRPGYIISAEPGVTYNLKSFTAYAYVPVALVRNRTQSYADKQKTEATGVYTHGDAAFADYAVNVGISVRF
jgi:hypothetical protein